jgi:hypothetical protein
MFDESSEEFGKAHHLVAWFYYQQMQVRDSRGRTGRGEGLTAIFFRKDILEGWTSKPTQ